MRSGRSIMDINYLLNAADALSSASRITKMSGEIKRRLSNASSHFKGDSWMMKQSKINNKKLKLKGDPANPFSKKGKYGLSTGVYRGKIKTRRKRHKMEIKKEKYMARGACQTSEFYGNVAHPQCVYVGHSTYAFTQFRSVIAKAMCRKLLQIAGIDIDNDERVIPLQYDGVSSDHAIVLYGTPSTGQGTPTQVMRYDFGSGETLKSITESFTPLPGGAGDSLVNLVGAAIQNTFNTGASFNWDRLDIYFRDKSGTDTLKLQGSMNLRQYKCELWSKSIMKIQNRSKGATSGDVDATAVDNQPLRGLLYEFNKGSVSTKQQGTIWNQDPVSFNGTILKNAASFAASGALGNPWREPQPAKVFNNCNKSAHVRLQPGDIKTSSIQHVYKGATFNDLIFKLAIRSANTDPANRGVQQAAGKVQMFALEELINTGELNQIVLQFECDRTIGCLFKKVKKNLMLIHHEEFPVIPA